MSRNLKWSLLLVAAAAVTVFVAANSTSDEAATSDEGPPMLVRPDSPLLSEGPDAVFVEVLDFECEACGAAFPVVEAMREVYGERITFVVRYLPLHTNSENAAKAAEAARLQGEFEAMYRRLFETQADWGHQPTSRQDKFFAYASDLGLDMDRFETDFNDPETAARIAQSKADVRAFGALGTPTFFLDGEMLGVDSLDSLMAAIDTAVNN